MGWRAARFYTLALDCNTRRPLLSAMNTGNFDSTLAHLSTSGWEIAAPMFLSLWQGAPQDLKYGLMAGAGLLATGREVEGTALLSHMADRGHIIRTAQYNPQINPLLREASVRADRAIRKSFSDVQRRVIADCVNPGRIKTALWPQTHDGPPTFPKTDTPPEKAGPRPYIFYAPDLPKTNVFEHADWAEALGQKAQDIKDEYFALIDKNARVGAPYVDGDSGFGPDWDPVKGDKNWTAVHLFKDGVQQAEAKACPLTCAALDAVPLTRQNDVPIEVFFSVLAPGIVIPRHYGLANCRVTVHVPLVVPSPNPDICGIRVGEQTQGWVEDKPLIFDDSFDHSAWNKSSETRVVLIFEAWRPDMTKGEIDTVKASYAAREAYLRERAGIVKKIRGLKN